MRQQIDAWAATWQEAKQAGDALLTYMRANNDVREELERCRHELAAAKAALQRERAMRLLLELGGPAPPPAPTTLLLVKPQ